MSSPSSSSLSPSDYGFNNVGDYATSDNGETSPRQGTSTVASSPPPNASSEFSCAVSEADIGVENVGDDVDVAQAQKEAPPSQEETEMERRLKRLDFVLRKSAAFSDILKTRMDEEKARQLALQEEKRQREEKSGKKRGRPTADFLPNGKRKKGLDGEPVRVDEDEDGEVPVFQQPAAITGAQLKPYQLEGLQWMVSLDQNGISGILADEMGLGKTLQTIAFSAYLREHHNYNPFLIICPLSVLHNWVDEYKKFAPSIPVCMYHGIPAERAELRRTVMAPPGTKKPPKRGKKKGPSKAKGPRKSGRPRKTSVKASTSAVAPVEPRRSGRPRKSIVIIESDSEGDDDEFKPEDEEDEEQADEDEEMDVEEPDPTGYTASFPIVLTTYEMIIKDRKYLANYKWGYIVVDEGHRLKNLDCKLMTEIKKYTSAGRMILTGTPLHNNLAELWSLLNFILPDIFDDLHTFQDWFNLPELQSSLPTTQSQQIISSLHAILKPFLLRRLKVDVEANLPPKKEYVLYAPLSVRQREAYDRVLDGEIRNWLIKGGTKGKMASEQADGPAETTKEEEEEEIAVEDEDEEQEEEVPKRRISRRAAKSGRKDYAVDGDDDEYFAMVERGDTDERGVKIKKSREEEEAEEVRIGKEYRDRAKVKQVNNMKLQNTVMQLRKVCQHPFLFDWPIDPDTLNPVLGEELLNASGKMMVLDRLLGELFKRGHKVLLFSQFTTMLDIIEEWAVDFMEYKICRIDGSTAPLERRAQMDLFQTGGDDPDAPRLFLLSTRAGGLGINLVAADTVIFYDQDWNPQMDAQAQDRAHRIGQTKPVLIYRLVSAHTIETKIMERATGKRKLEALIIAKGKFKMPAAAASTKRETMAELATSLLRLEGEKIEVVPNTKEGKKGVLSDEDLDVLLDRRPEVFAERGVGWGSSAIPGAETTTERKMKDAVSAKAEEGEVKKAAFAVYKAPPEEGNDALAKMMGEED